MYLLIRIVFVLTLYISLIYSENILFVFLGDMMLGSDWPKNYLPPEYEDVFEYTRKIISNGDVTIANLEGSISTADTRPRKRGRHTFSFRMPPKSAMIINRAGIDVVNLANNHSWDFGQRGFAQTTNLLKKKTMYILQGLKTKP